MSLERKTHEQDAIAAKSQLSSLKADYMGELTTYLTLTHSVINERRAAALRCGGPSSGRPRRHDTADALTERRVADVHVDRVNERRDRRPRLNHEAIHVRTTAAIVPCFAERSARDACLQRTECRIEA